MKGNILAAGAILLSGLGVFLMADAATPYIQGVDVEKGKDALNVSFRVDPKGVRTGSTKIVEVTPALVAGQDTLRLDAVRIAGKQAWYVTKREGRIPDEGLLRAGSKDLYQYKGRVALPEGFETGRIELIVDTADICRCAAPREGIVPVADLDFRPKTADVAFRYVAPTDTAEKIFNLSGKANVIFKVNRTEIDWSYASNYAELDTIVKTIEVVRNNPDAKVETITLTGYASPEGSYANNVRLAKGRTEAVKEYVAVRSNFPQSVYRTSYVPEDWAGLRDWLEASSMPGREEMIAFIDDKSVPEADRNDIFRARFPEQYPVLLREVYPLLRHTDYVITYSVKKYYDINEIREVMRRNPRNLSVNELFLLANSSGPGTPDHEEAILLAAQLYPENKVANLNAAGVAIGAGRYDEAERYLSRVGDGPDADYARGILLLMKKDYAAATPLLERASAAGIGEADAALKELRRLQENPDEIRVLRSDIE